jgi:hypothetical protein
MPDPVILPNEDDYEGPALVDVFSEPVKGEGVVGDLILDQPRRYSRQTFQQPPPFREEQHPRGRGGKFAPKGGGGTATAAPGRPQAAPKPKGPGKPKGPKATARSITGKLGKSLERQRARAAESKQGVIDHGQVTEVSRKRAVADQMATFAPEEMTFRPDELRSADEEVDSFDDQGEAQAEAAARHPIVQLVSGRFGKIAEAYGNPTEWSKTKHTDPATGDYTAERADLHKKIVDMMLTTVEGPKGRVQADTRAKPGEKPKAFILIGVPGSGKTTVSSKVAPKGVNFAVLNADDAKSALPEYQGWNAGLLHEESSDIVEGDPKNPAVHERSAMARGMAERRHLTFDITGKNSAKVMRWVEQLASKGYEVHAAMADLPPEKAATRAWKRFRKNAMGIDDPNKPGGRFVPLKYVWSGVDHKPAATYEALKASEHVKSWKRVSTDVPFGEDTPVLDEGER